MDDESVMQREIEDAEAVALVQTDGVLLKGGVLLRLYEAIVNKIPIMCVLIPRSGCACRRPYPLPVAAVSGQLV